MTDMPAGAYVCARNGKYSRSTGMAKIQLPKRLFLNDKPMRVVRVAGNADDQTSGESTKQFFYVPLQRSFTKSPMLIIHTPRAKEEIVTALGNEAARSILSTDAWLRLIWRETGRQAVRAEIASTSRG